MSTVKQPPFLSKEATSCQIGTGFLLTEESGVSKVYYWTAMPMKQYSQKIFQGKKPEENQMF